jgi:hypothetical protein
LVLYKENVEIATYNNIGVENNGEFSFQLPIFLDYEVCYKWRIRSLDSFGEYSNWS